jgi:hypothetical protein
MALYARRIYLLGYVYDGRAERFGIRSDLRLMIPVDLP